MRTKSIFPTFTSHLSDIHSSKISLFMPYFMFQGRHNYDVIFTLLYGCLKDVFWMLWISQRCLLDVMNFSKMSFGCYEFLKDVFCMLLISQRSLLYVIDFSKMSFVCY